MIYFFAHVVIGSAIEVLVGPAKEVFLTICFVGLVVADRELGFRLKEICVRGGHNFMILLLI